MTIREYRLDNSDQIGPLNPNSADERHAAMVTVCAHANNAADARLLMRALGLVGTS